MKTYLRGLIRTDVRQALQGYHRADRQARTHVQNQRIVKAGTRAVSTSSGSPMVVERPVEIRQLRFATYPYRNYEILKRIFLKRRGLHMAVPIPPLPEIEQVSSNVIRILGGNPSKFTLQGTNTYLLGSGKQRILIDTGEGYPAWKESLSSVLKEQGNPEIETCLLTHWHLDHILGVPDTKTLSPNVNFYKHLNKEYDPEKHLTNETIGDITDGQRFGVGNQSDKDFFEVEALYCPGHAKDHMAFLITRSPDEAEVGSIFTADNVLGHGTAVFEDLAQYVASLHLMQKRAGIGRKAYPGHGAVIEDARSKLAEYIAHRRMREEEAMNVLTWGTTTKPGAPRTSSPAGFPESQPPPESGVGSEVVVGKEWESMEMVRVIYRHYPENLWQPAEFGLLQVLGKLVGEGKVTKIDAEGSGKDRWKMTKLPEDAFSRGRSSRSGSPGGDGKL